MILHTTIPMEMVFPSDPAVYSRTVAASWNGIPLIVEECEGRYRITRIMSSNPFDYLIEEITPGQYIQLSDML